MLRATLALCVLTVAALAGRASAQAGCPRVLAGFEPPGTNGKVTCFCTYDDGSGPALYLGGEFGAAGTAGAARIARYDGVAWSALGAGVAQVGSNQPAVVTDMVVFDFGAGPRLVAGGRFDRADGAPANNVAAWDGTSWRAVGSGLDFAVNALVVFDDGAGPKLYVGGDFRLPALHVARWNGTAWEQVGAGLVGVVRDLAVHDDGTGAALHAAGSMFSSGTQPGVRKWTGSSWVPVGTALEGVVNGLASHDDGSGPKLYVEIAGLSPAMQGVRRWNGAAWENVGTIGGGVWSLSAIDLLDGQGTGLFASGGWGLDPSRIARWNGATWSNVGSGPLSDAWAVSTLDVGGERRLIAGASLGTSFTLTAYGIARLAGSTWTPVQSGQGIVGNDVGSVVSALAQHDSGAGPEIHAGGRALSARPDVVSVALARWTGTVWATAPGHSQFWPVSVLAIQSVDLGGVSELWMGTEFGGAYRLAGTTWSWMDGGTGSLSFSAVDDFLVFDSAGAPRLAMAGWFLQGEEGATPIALVKTWDGSTWTLLGQGPLASRAHALAVFDDGEGPRLYCGGKFASLGGVPGTTGIARWDGSAWSSVGGGMGVNGAVHALVVHDDGSGPALYAGGRFDSVGGAPIADIARWSSTGWSAVGAGGTTGAADRAVHALESHDDGSVSQLWAGGTFASIGGVAANRLAHWNGGSWSPLGIGADERVDVLASFDENDGGPRTLWAGGRFSSIDGRAASRVARIACGPDNTGFPSCFGDAAHGPTPCPCGNAGATGHGCASAASAAGAILRASGSTAPTGPGGADTVVLACSDMPATTTALFAQSTHLGAPIPFGDGLRCLGGTQIRLGTKVVSAGSASYPGPGDIPISVRGMTPFGSALTRHYEVWYRTALPLCTSATFNMSNALTITW